MFTKYIFLPGSTVEEIYSDLAKLLTGETDRNNLSASCDKSLTRIVATTPAGWVKLSETATSGIFQAYHTDGTTKKFVRIGLIRYSTSYFLLALSAIEDVTELGVVSNELPSSFSVSFDLDFPATLQGGLFYLSVAESGIFLVLTALKTNWNPNANAPLNVQNILQAVAEYTREDDWNLPGYPSVCVGSFNSSVFTWVMLKVKNDLFIDTYSTISTTVNTQSLKPVCNADLKIAVITTDVRVGYTTGAYGILGGVLHRIRACDYGNIGDVLVIENIPYIVIPLRLPSPNAPHNILLPID